MAKKTSKKASKTAKSRNAAQTAMKKRSGTKSAARSSARKAVKAKARATTAKSSVKKPARPKQRIAVSHHREEDFKADGLRAYAKYRDLGIAEASHGLAQAHVIRLQVLAIRPKSQSCTSTTSNSRWSTCSRAG